MGSLHNLKNTAGMSEPIGAALFGLGRAGMIHFGNLIGNPRVNLLYLVEADEAKASSIKEKYRLTGTTVLNATRMNEVFENSQVSAVIVCTPTFTHEDVVKGALQHGKAVFCEKPISESQEGTKACYEAAEKAGKPLLCSFNRRYDPSVRALKTRVRNGEVGTIHSVRTCSRDSPFPPIEYLRISGGLYHDCAVHDIDMVCWILGEFPTSVYSMAHAHNQDIAEIKDVDTVAIVMKFASGIIATIDLSRNSTYGYDQRLEVFGSQGMLVSQNQKPNELTAYGCTGIKQGAYKFSFPERYEESYILALEHFLDAVEGGGKVEVTQEETLTVCSIASACEKSQATGMMVAI